MITRIEIDGFKSFENFTLDLQSFAVILGPNAAGKSNLFDALRLLSGFAIGDLRSAVLALRGEAHELFRQNPDGKPSRHMRFALELLLPWVVTDDFGAKLELTCTRIRYAVTIERRDEEGIERLFVIEEEARPITKAADKERLNRGDGGPLPDGLLRYGKRKNPFLVTSGEAGNRLFELYQDQTQGRKRSLPAVRAERSVLSGITLAREFPTLYALKRELASIRYLQLDPNAPRQPSSFDMPDDLLEDGSNLAAVLYRVQTETRDENNPQGALADIAADLSEIIPGIIDLMVQRDEERRQYSVTVRTRDGDRFSSRIISDGTLRVLALLTLLHDPRSFGVLCFEEPENGVHKDRLARLMERLEERCRPAENKESTEPVSQIVVNTHSPVAAEAARKNIILAQLREHKDPSTGLPRRASEMTPYALVDQGDLLADDKSARVARYQIERFLEDAESRAGL